MVSLYYTINRHRVGAGCVGVCWCWSCGRVLCLSMLRLDSGQPCSRCRFGRFDRPVDRSTYTSMSSGRVASNSAETESFRAAAAPTQAALCTFECARRGFAAFFVRSRSASCGSRAIHRQIASPGFVARIRAPRHACASARLSRTAAVRVAQLAHRAFKPRLTRPTLSKRASCPPRSITCFSQQRQTFLVFG